MSPGSFFLEPSSALWSMRQGILHILQPAINDKLRADSVAIDLYDVLLQDASCIIIKTLPFLVDLTLY